MPHAHDHTHRADTLGTARLVIAVILNLAITIMEVGAGVWAGSLALLADAAHNLNDTASLGISLGARKVAQREADRRRTFGYRRAEVIGAFVNLITLVVIALYLLKEAVERAVMPQPVNGTLMMIVAGGALIANVGTALLLRRGAEGSLNIESAFVHIVADAMASVAVIGGGGAIMLYGWTWIDPLLTALISGYILWQSADLLRRTTRILMESAPPGFDFDGLIEEMRAVDHVRDVHHVHVWQIDEHSTAMEAHVVVPDGDPEVIEPTKTALKDRIADTFDVEHATLEVEWTPCGAEEPVWSH